MTRRVAVLGCGPAGLVAMHSAVAAGSVATCFSRRRKSEMYGSQYLHEPIPGVPGIPSSVVTYALSGSPEGYLTKVYGAERAVPDNWTDAESGDRPAWDIRATYDWLWDRYWPQVIDVDLTAHNLSMIVNGFDVVISSVPMPMLCREKDTHAFPASYIWAAGDAPGRGIRLPDEWRVEDGMILRSGELEVAWTRVSCTYGHMTVEWPDGPEKPWPTAARVPKPVTTTCSCWPEIVRVGRYGKWDKDGLVHDVYGQVQEAITLNNPQEKSA